MVDFDLKNKKSEPIELENKKPILDKLGRAYATGRRKTSVSRVWLKNMVLQKLLLMANH